MKRFYYTLIILLSTFTYNFGQNNWKEGYLILTNNDTIKGLIDDRDTKSNSKKCYFKESINSETIKYTPENIHGYRFTEGKFYISKKIDGYLEEPLFLEFLIKGIVNIYHVKDDVDRYFIEKDTLFHELKNTTEIKIIDGTKYEVEKNEYAGTLIYLMQDANFKKKISQCELEPKSLIKISKDYHETVCLDEKCIVFEKSERKVDVSFGLHAGLSMNTFNFGGKLKTNYSLGKLIGCRLVINNSFDWFERLDFHIYLTLQRFSEYKLHSISKHSSLVTYEGDDYYIVTNPDTDPRPNRVKNLDVNINTTTLKVPLTLNYLILSGKFKPYIGLGLTNMFILSQNKDFIYHQFYNQFDRSIPVYHYGITGKIGGSYKINNRNIYFDLIYEYSQSTNINQIWRMKNQLFSFNLGFDF